MSTSREEGSLDMIGKEVRIIDLNEFGEIILKKQSESDDYWF